MKKFFLLPFLVLNANIISAQSSPQSPPDTTVISLNDSVFVVKNKILYSKYSNDSIMFFQNGIKINKNIIFFKSGITEPQLKRLLWKSGAMFISGAADGVAETLKFHYDRFKYVFPNVNDSIWNPSLSWRRKYLNNDPNQGPKFFGSTGPFVMFTDYYHKIKMIRNTSMIIGVTIPIGGHTNISWKDYLLESIVLYAINNIGFCLTYDVIFKKR